MRFTGRRWPPAKRSPPPLAREVFGNRTTKKSAHAQGMIPSRRFVGVCPLFGPVPRVEERHKLVG